MVEASKIISRGAEAVLYKGKWEDVETLVKERLKKGYRVEELDKKLRRERTKAESKLLSKARRARVSTPKVYEIEPDKGIIKMEFLKGELLKEVISKISAKEKKELFKKAGRSIARLHKAGLIHGDLTTSNLILQNDEIYFIDFGLGFHSQSLEDRGVDLFLLYEVLKSSHPEDWKVLWKGILEGYKGEFSQADPILKRVREIEKRRRYKEK